MQEKFSFKRFVTALITGLIGAFALRLAPVLLVPVVAAAGYFGAFWGVSYALVALALTGCGSALTASSDVSMLVSVVAAEIAGAGLLTAGLRKKWPYRYIALALAGVLLLSLYGCIALPQVLAGREPYAGVMDSLAEIKSIQSMYGVEDDRLLGINSLIEQTPEIFFGSLVMMAEAGALIATVLPAAVGKKRGHDLRAMAPFSEWRLPPSLKIGLPAIAGAVLLAYLFKREAAPTIAYTVLCTLMPLFAATGLSLMLFLARRRPIGRGMMTAFAVLATLFAPVFTALTGVFDLYSSFRGRLLRTDKLIRAAFEKAEREKLNSVVVDFGDGRGPQVIAVRKRSNNDAFFDARSGHGGDETGEGRPGGDGENDNENDSDNNNDNNNNTDNGGL